MPSGKGRCAAKTLNTTVGKIRWADCDVYREHPADPSKWVRVAHVSELRHVYNQNQTPVPLQVLAKGHSEYSTPVALGTQFFTAFDPKKPPTKRSRRAELTRMSRDQRVAAEWMTGHRRDIHEAVVAATAGGPYEINTVRHPAFPVATMVQRLSRLLEFPENFRAKDPGLCKWIEHSPAAVEELVRLVAGVPVARCLKLHVPWKALPTDVIDSKVRELIDDTGWLASATLPEIRSYVVAIMDMVTAGASEALTVELLHHTSSVGVDLDYKSLLVGVMVPRIGLRHPQGLTILRQLDATFDDSGLGNVVTRGEVCSALIKAAGSTEEDLQEQVSSGRVGPRAAAEFRDQLPADIEDWLLDRVTGPNVDTGLREIVAQRQDLRPQNRKRLIASLDPCDYDIMAELTTAEWEVYADTVDVDHVLRRTDIPDHIAARLAHRAVHGTPLAEGVSGHDRSAIVGQVLDDLGDQLSRKDLRMCLDNCERAIYSSHPLMSYASSPRKAAYIADYFNNPKLLDISAWSDLTNSRVSDLKDRNILETIALSARTPEGAATAIRLAPTWEGTVSELIDWAEQNTA